MDLHLDQRVVTLSCFCWCCCVARGGITSPSSDVSTPDPLMQASARRAFQSHQTLGGKRDEARFSIRTANISRYRVPHFIGARCVVYVRTLQPRIRYCKGPRPGCLALMRWLRRNEGAPEGEKKKVGRKKKRICFLWQCTRQRPGTGCQVRARVALDGNARNIYPSGPSSASTRSAPQRRSGDIWRDIDPTGTGALLLAMHLSHLGPDGRGQLVGIQAV